MKQSAALLHALEPGALNRSKVTYTSDAGGWLEGHRTTASYLSLRDDRLILREFEKTLGYIYWTKKSSTLIPLYACKKGDAHFLSNNTSCDGGIVQRTEGYIEDATVTGPNLVTLYTCRASANQTDYFNSIDASCEGNTQVGTVGKI